MNKGRIGMVMKYRLHLAASTSLMFCSALTANAQTPASDQSSASINLGSVTANGQAGGYVAPSGTGTRAQAVAKQKDAPNILFVQPASEIRKRPDSNGAEAFRRIPGVAMQSDSGFGRFLTIRGLAEDLNATEYAGVDLPAVNTNANPGGGSRGVSLDFLPPGLIGGAQVIATLTPDIPATGLGGVADILPPELPVDGRPVLNVTAAGGYTPAQGHGLAEGSITAGGHFAIPGMASMQNNKPFSFIGSFGYFNASPGIFDEEEGYTNPTVAGQPSMLNYLQLRRYNNNRITQGTAGEFAFDPNTAVHLYVRGMYSYDNESIQKNELYLQNLDGTNGGAVIDNGNNDFTATGANLNKYYENSAERVGMTFLEGGGQFIVDNLVTLNVHSAYTEGFDKFTRDYVSNFNSNDQNLTVDYNASNPALRTYSVSDASGAAVNPADASNFSFTDLTNYPSHTTDKIYDNGFDASAPTTFFNTLGTFKVGGNFSLRSRNRLQNTISLTPVNGPFSLPSVTGGQPGQTDYGNTYPVGPNLNYDEFFAIPYGPLQPATDQVANLQGYQHDSENIYAGFAQEDVQFGKFEALAGARVEATQDSFTAYGSTTSAGGTTTVNATPTTNSISYVNLFPTFQMKYAFTNALQGRFSYSTGIARPGFQQINPAVSVTFNGAAVGAGNLITKGNPNLKPMTGDSFDLALGYFTQHGGLLEADAFQKDFKNYVIANSFFQGGNQFQTFSNINGAVARGVTLEAIQNLYFLPKPLDGLGLEANATYVDATADVIPGQGRSILPQTYPLTINATESYKTGPFEFDVDETYNSRNLYTVASDPSTNIYTQPVLQLDVSAFYNVTPKLQVFFQGNNLTNYKLEFTQSASSTFPVQREYYGQKFIVGVHYALGS
ncbi:MAG: TonB-dependent receptor [Acidocella sp.]|nr:TonB-dependent receptor [Acidocella sp.]